MAQGYLGKSRRSAAKHAGERKRNHPQERSSTGRWDAIKGEGNYKAAREFDEAERKFVESGKVDEAVRDVGPKSEAEKREMEEAEEQAKKRAKDEDPALFRKPRAKSR